MQFGNVLFTLVCYGSSVSWSHHYQGLRPNGKGRKENVMKSIRSRLLSLLVALALVCSLVPGALAAATGSITVSNSTIDINGSSTLTMNVSGLTSGTTYDCTWSIESSSTGTATLSATNVQPDSSSIKTTISGTGNGFSSTSITVTGKTAGSLKIKATVTDPSSPSTTIVSSTTDLTVNTPATPVLTLSTSRLVVEVRALLFIVPQTQQEQLQFMLSFGMALSL